MKLLRKSLSYWKNIRENKIWNNYHRYYMRRQVDWALLNFDEKILSIYYELSKISSKLNFNFYKILIKFQDRQYGYQNVQHRQS